MLNTSDVKSLSKGGTTVSLEEISNSIDNKLSIDNLKAGNEGIIINKAASGEFVEVKNNIKAGNNITISSYNNAMYIGFNTNQAIDGLTLAAGQYSEIYADGSYGINFIWNDQGKSTTTLPIAYSGQDATVLTNRNTKTLFGNQSIFGSGNIDLYRHVITVKGYSNDAAIEPALITLISSKSVKIDSLTKLFTALSDYAETGYPASGAEKVHNETVISIFPSATGSFETSTGSSIPISILEPIEVTDTVTTV